MLPEISLNILDVTENSIRAGASLINIEVSVDTKEDTLEVLIKDDGCGMSKEQVQKVIDPFYTTRTTRKVGLGIPFFRQAAESTGGSFLITSAPGTGTTVRAVFGLSHIDRMPLGNLNASIHTLIIYNESVNFRYRYAYDDREFVLDTREVKEILGGVPLNTPDVSDYLKEFLQENQFEVDGGTAV